MFVRSVRISVCSFRSFFQRICSCEFVFIFGSWILQERERKKEKNVLPISHFFGHIFSLSIKSVLFPMVETICTLWIYYWNFYFLGSIGLISMPFLCCCISSPGRLFAIVFFFYYFFCIWIFFNRKYSFFLLFTFYCRIFSLQIHNVGGIKH